jgi:hypothetical protein
MMPAKLHHASPDCGVRRRGRINHGGPRTHIFAATREPCRRRTRVDVDRPCRTDQVALAATAADLSPGAGAANRPEFGDVRHRGQSDPGDADDIAERANANLFVGAADQLPGVAASDFAIVIAADLSIFAADDLPARIANEPISLHRGRPPHRLCLRLQRNRSRRALRVRQPARPSASHSRSARRRLRLRLPRPA